MFAEQRATALTTLNSTGTESQAFASGQLYLLTNYIEKDEPNASRHYLTVTGEGAPALMQEEDADRAFVVVQNNDQEGTYMFTSPTISNRLGFNGELASVYTDNAASVQCGTLDNDNQSKYIITPYIDGSNTYFTIRPYNVNDNISSLTPYLGANDEDGVADATLRLVNGQSSSYSRQQSDVTANYDFGDVFFTTSRWQLVEAKLYPPTVHMAPDGTVTLADEVNTSRGMAGSDYSIYYKVKPLGGEWPANGTQYTAQPTLGVGDELEAWIAANDGGDYSHMGTSESIFFVARQVAAPQAVIDGNTVSFEAEEGATVYYSQFTDCIDMGNTPEANSSVSGYTTPFEQTLTGNICYCAYAPDCIKSVMCSLYHQAVLPLEIIEPDNNNNVTLAIANSQIPSDYYGIYYTLDGSEPTRSSVQYSGTPISLSGFTILKAKAFSNNINYLDSPIKTYYHHSQYLVFTYKAGNEENVGENMMLLATGSNNATNSENAIDGTLLWIGPNTYQATGSPIYNEATSSYLTFDLPQDGVIVPYGTSTASEARLWHWGGETGDNGYQLYTVEDGTTYYLAYNANATENKWHIVTAAGSGDNLAVAYRADMTEYAGGYEFAAEGVNLFMDGVALANDNTAWVALSEGETANLRLSLNGTKTTIDANTNINIYKDGSLWQRWHRKDGVYYQTHTALGLATSEQLTDFFDPDSASNWVWTLNATNYFTILNAGDDVSHNAVTRTTNAVSTPDFGSLLTVTYTPNNAYADAAASSVDLHLYAESRSTTSVAGEWRFANRLITNTSLLTPTHVWSWRMTTLPTCRQNPPLPRTTNIRSMRCGR